MTAEELAHLSERELRQRANESFAQAESAGGLDKPYLLAEAQFYLRELERRADARISLRDLILEVVVIVLIGFEIVIGVVGIREGTEQFRLAADALIALKSLQKEQEKSSGVLDSARKALETQVSIVQEQNHRELERLARKPDIEIAVTVPTANGNQKIAVIGRSGFSHKRSPVSMQLNGAKDLFIDVQALNKGSAVLQEGALNVLCISRDSGADPLVAPAQARGINLPLDDEDWSVFSNKLSMPIRNIPPIKESHGGANASLRLRIPRGPGVEERRFAAFIEFVGMAEPRSGAVDFIVRF
ncbi:MAG TPA: hypothetical protein VEK84_07115 [Terriglobales bacterium]|nr:hypothetical protein [Terriglobales bacterium]